MLGVIAVESTDRFSGQHTAEILKGFLSWFSIHLNARLLSRVNLALRKCGHFVGYGLLSFLFFRACRGTYRVLNGYYDWRTSRLARLPRQHVFGFLWKMPWALLALAVTILTATADELHQMRIPSRTGSWWDVLLDGSAGLVVQILIFSAAMRNSRRGEHVPTAPSAMMGTDK